MMCGMAVVGGEWLGVVTVVCGKAKKVWGQATGRLKVTPQSSGLHGRRGGLSRKYCTRSYGHRIV